MYCDKFSFAKYKFYNILLMEQGIDKLPGDILFKFRLVAMLPEIFLTSSYTMVVLGVGLLPYVFWVLWYRKKLFCKKDTPELRAETIAAPSNSDQSKIATQYLLVKEACVNSFFFITVALV